jgi:site-specific recombinase XerD
MTLQKLSDLVIEVEQGMRESGYCKETIRRYRKIWRRFIAYSSERADEVCDFSTENLGKFIDKCYLGKGKAGQLCKPYRQRILRAVGILTEYQSYGRFAFARHARRKDYSCPIQFQTHIDKYFAQKIEEGISESWQESFTAEMRKFVSFLLDNNVDCFESLDSNVIGRYVTQLDSYSPHMLSSMLGRLRGFFRWMYFHEILSADLSIYFPSVNRCSFPSHIPAIWSQDDIQKMLSVIDRESPVGKRDYAVLLLLARTGLRASDALFLEFSNLNWSENTIELVQKKTNQPLSIPLMEEVGLAIIDYLRNGRPSHANSSCIFVRHTPPFNAFISGHSFHYQIDRYLERSGVAKPVGKTYGTHSFRHSLATEMLKKQTPLPVIAEVLGHTSVQSTAAYLRTDIEQLRECALDLGGVGL